MAKKIKIDVEVNGKMQKATVSAKKLKKQLDGVEKEGKQAAASMGQLDRNIKGTAAISANATKNFSKMQQGMGGLVGAYATLAARVFALTAAFNFLKTAGDLAALERGQDSYARRTGASMRLLTKNIQDATGGLVSYKDAAQAAAIGNAAGLTADQLSRLGTIAKNAGTILGRDVTDSFNRLTRGAIKAEPELLDELGIIVRLKDASEDYARALNLNANSLTTFQKSQAVVNATIEEGERKFQDVGDDVNNVSRLGASLQDSFKKAQIALAEIADFVGGVLIDSTYALIAAVGLLGVSFIRALTPAAPALVNVSQAATAARTSLVSAAAAGPQASATGAAVAQGKFGAAQLRYLEQASKKSTGAVRADFALMGADFKKAMLIIRAEALLTSSANEGFFRGMYSRWVAGLYVYQAEYGKVMGFLKAVGASTARFLSSVLSFASYIGLAIIAFQFAKKAIDYFKDPELKRIELVAKNAKEQFARTAEEVQKIRDGLTPARSAMEEIVQQANLLSNFTFKEFNQLLNNLDRSFDFTEADLSKLRKDLRAAEPELAALAGIASEATATMNNMQLQDPNIRLAFSMGGERSAAMVSYSDAAGRAAQATGAFNDTLTDTVSALGLTAVDLEKIKTIFEGLDEGIGNLQTQMDILKQADITVPGLADAFAALEATIAAGLDPSKPELFAQAILDIQGNYSTFIDLLRAGTGELQAQSQAFKALTQALEEYERGAESFKPKDSLFTPLLNATQTALDSLDTIFKDRDPNTSVQEFFAKDGFQEGEVQYNALLKILGKTGEQLEENLSYEQLRVMVAAQLNQLKGDAFALERSMTKLQTVETKLLRGASTLQADKVKREIAVLKAKQELANLDTRYNLAMKSGLITSEQQTLQYQQQRALLEEQVLSAEALADDFEALGMVAKNSLESGISSGLHDLITGKESSLGDALLNLGKGVLTDISKQLSDMLARTITDALFDIRDPAEAMNDAMMNGGDLAAGAIRQAMIDGSEYFANLLGIGPGGFGGSVGPQMSPVPLTATQQAFASTPGTIPAGPMSPVPPSATTQALYSSAAQALPPAANPATSGPLGPYNPNIMAATAFAGNANPTGSGGDGGNEKQTEATNKLTEVMGENVLETGSNITALGSAIFALTGNEKAAKALAVVSTAMRLATLAQTLWTKISGKTTFTALGLNTQALERNTAQLMASQTGAKTGGVFSNGAKLPGYAAGGVSRGPQHGYPVELHGTEAVVPLPNNRSIPVELSGGGQGDMINNTVTVNVSSDSKGNGQATVESSKGQEEGLGRAIAAAVQQELQKQKRPGGILSPVGAA